MELSQLIGIGGGGEWWSWLLWFIFFMVFFMFYPRIMVSQIMWKLDSSARNLEQMSEEARKFVIGQISKKPDKRVKESVDRFFEFFTVEPVSLDPNGIIKRIDHLIRNQKERFDYFTESVAPDMDEEKKACIQMGMAAGIELYTISKIVRHYVELIKKTKSYQIAMILQMQLPLIERIAKALSKGTKSLALGEPIGDAVGPWVVANLMDGAKPTEIEEDIMMAEKKMEGRHVFLIKARGPGGRIGYPGKAAEKIMKKHRIARIISIDAAAKLEGEKTGSVAEGVGVAMGGPGVERSYIENAAVEGKVPLDSIIVKMSPEEAIQPMRKSMKDAFPEVLEAIKRSIGRTKKKDKLIIIGVGNTSGVGNSKKDAEKTAKWIEGFERKEKSKKK